MINVWAKFPAITFYYVLNPLGPGFTPFLQIFAIL